MKTTPKRGGARGRRGRGRGGGWAAPATRVSNDSPAVSVSSDAPSEASKTDVTPEKKTPIKKKRKYNIWGWSFHRFININISME